jgi:hypothetical protein
LIEYPPLLLWNTRNTWLSGMSPVAAEAASPDRAPGEPEPLAVVGVDALPVVAAGWDDPEPPEDVAL